MLIGFATRDGQHVDEELRRAAQLVVYEVSAAGYRIARRHAFEAGAGQRSDDRIRALAGCEVVYVRAIGPSLAARLAARRIRAATAPERPRIAELVARLSAWLAVRDDRVAR